MIPKILNIGSLNIDRVFHVDHVTRPGETLACSGVAVFAGGKGANQSVALARAGAMVQHVGKVGTDGQWLVQKLALENIDTQGVHVGAGPTGQALIQVDTQGQNAIVLFPGANHEITDQEIDRALGAMEPGANALLQNETNQVGYAIARAAQQGLRVWFNPAPFTPDVMTYPLEKVSVLFVNESEAMALSGVSIPDDIPAALARRLPDCKVVLTLGEQGAMYLGQGERLHVKAPGVCVVDTTAAGDTLIGYFIAGRLSGASVADSLQLACRAAALCVSRAGAIDSIPRMNEVVAAQENA